MNAVGRLGSYISRGVYTVSGPFHPFGGAVDIIVVEQPDGSFKSSPWYVRFGKFQGVLKNKQNTIKISVNGVATGLHMFLDHKGEAYFLREVDEVHEGESVVYPLSSGDEADEKTSDFGEIRRPIKSKSCNYGATGNSGPADEVDLPGPRRSGILGIVFGRRSVKKDQLREEGEVSGVERVSSLDRAEIAANLLEVKWSTNLDTSIKENVSQFSVGDEVNEKVAKDMQMNNEESQAYVPVQGTTEISMSDISLDQAVDSPSSSGEMSRNVGVISVDVGKFDSISGMTSADDLEASLSLQLEEQVCYQDDSVLQHCGEIYSKESGSERVQPFPLCETSESSSPTSKDFHEQMNTTLYLASEGNRGIFIHAGSTNAATEFLPQDAVAEQVAESGHGEPSIVPESVMVSIEPTVEEVELDSISSSHSGSSLSHHIQYQNSDMDDLHASTEVRGHSVSMSPTSIPHLGISEEDEFLFSDLDESKPTDVRHLESSSTDEVNANNKETTEQIDTCGEDISNDSGSSIKKSKMASSPVNIPKNHEFAGEEDNRLAESLPNWCSSIHDFDADYHQPFSHSLDSSSNSLEWTISKDESSSEKLENERQNVEDDQNTRAFKHVLANPEVAELSLCKHLLHEGMGAEAASQVFNAYKLDISKFASLGPTILQNDKLVVRIGGLYFPWDVAAPIVLGMASFGTAKIFNPKGMIVVDQVERSGEVASGGGSWNLWPFSLKRSRTDGKTTNSSREANNDHGNEKGSKPNIENYDRKKEEGSKPSIENYDCKKEGSKPNIENYDCKKEEESRPNIEDYDRKKEGGSRPNTARKMVRAKTPTSDQLASLNLKEGGNSVTFTFSTKMLGMQQVDARIYLWKWNNRIVISDVDGTITRSDVLGQFMPLVGIDWSQMGVAHLFSAIKENGYQLLFLSARAISQASVTRQFLVNLKQDGKSLPDGPIVISPDGLFPSLYREVIRRAPHEFKIACLEDIRALFPPENNNPFYAGFGNRDTDEISYLKVGIPRGKIFIINPKGEVAVNRCVDTRSYTSLSALAKNMFPATDSFEQEDFNSWNYWKLPPPMMDF